MAATKLKRKVSGAFQAATGAAVKYGLIDQSKGQLSTTDLYRDYKLAYSEEDKLTAMRKALLTPPMYQQLYDKFYGRKLPEDILDKLLIREFNVREADANKVAGYLVTGLKDLGLVGEDGTLNGQAGANPEETADDEIVDETVSELANADHEPPLPADASKYVVVIKGPGMKSEIQLLEPDDLLIVDAMLKKVRNKLEAAVEDAS